jgi:predicted DNA-binding transcriptional regulator AlpA
MGTHPTFIPETSGELTKMVGYEQIEKALDVSRSSIERAVKSGALPAPQKFGARSVWFASQINNWARSRLEQSLETLNSLASISVEQHEDVARAHVAAAISKRIGETVDPTTVDVHATRALTEEEFAEAESQEFARFDERFASLSVHESAILAAWFFRNLRPFIADMNSKALFPDDAKLREIGIAIVRRLPLPVERS